MRRQGEWHRRGGHSDPHNTEAHSAVGPGRQHPDAQTLPLSLPDTASLFWPFGDS